MLQLIKQFFTEVPGNKKELTALEKNEFYHDGKKLVRVGSKDEPTEAEIFEEVREDRI